MGINIMAFANAFEPGFQAVGFWVHSATLLAIVCFSLAAWFVEQDR